MSTWAIVVAAGAGERFGERKQFQRLGPDRVVDWALRAAGAHCDGVVLVVPADAVGTGAAADAVVVGGATRSASVRAGLAALPADAEVVVVHDAARPAVPFSDIDALFEAAEKSDAVVLASPLRAPLVEVDEGGGAVAYHLPGSFMHVLTPQAFSKEKFAEMAAGGKDLHPSQVRLLKGSSLNVRLGGGGDAGLVKAMINMLPKPKVRPPSSPFEEAQW